MPTRFTPKKPPMYVLPGTNPGLLVRGTIDINNRPEVKNRQEGGISTVYSSSDGVEINGHHYEMLFPQVIPVGGGNYRVVGFQRAKQYALRTGKHLGLFDTPNHAESYARRLHIQQAHLIQTRRFGSAG